MQDIQDSQRAKDLKILRMNVLARATDMFIAGKIKREEILTVAEKLAAWVEMVKK